METMRAVVRNGLEAHRVGVRSGAPRFRRRASVRWTREYDSSAGMTGQEAIVWMTVSYTKEPCDHGDRVQAGRQTGRGTYRPTTAR